MPRRYWWDDERVEAWEPRDPTVRDSGGPSRVDVSKEADPEYRPPPPAGFTARLPGCEHYGHRWQAEHQDRAPGKPQRCRCLRCGSHTFATPTEGLAP